MFPPLVLDVLGTVPIFVLLLGKWKLVKVHQNIQIDMSFSRVGGKSIFLKKHSEFLWVPNGFLGVKWERGIILKFARNRGVSIERRKY
jgi:hypothetical protein